MKQNKQEQEQAATKQGSSPVDISQLSEEQKASLLAQLNAEAKNERINKRDAYEGLRGEFMHKVEECQEERRQGDENRQRHNGRDVLQKLQILISAGTRPSARLFRGGVIESHCLFRLPVYEQGNSVAGLEAGGAQMLEVVAL